MTLTALVISPARQFQSELSSVLARRNACTTKTVDSMSALVAALEESIWSIIITIEGEGVPTGCETLSLLKARNVSSPLLVVSDALDERQRLNLVRDGADDVLRLQDLLTLDESMERALETFHTQREADMKQEQRVITERAVVLNAIAGGTYNRLTNTITGIRYSADALSMLLESPPQSDTRNAIVASVADLREGTDRLREALSDLEILIGTERIMRRDVDVVKVMEAVLGLSWIRSLANFLIECDYRSVPRVLAEQTMLAQSFLLIILEASRAVAKTNQPSQRIRITTRTHEDGRVLVEIDTHLPQTDKANTRVLRGPELILNTIGGELLIDRKTLTFRVLLPASVEVDNKEGRLRLLVIDDEERVCSALRRAFGSDHDVVVTTHAQSALEWIWAGKQFDLILCDLMMPAMNGMQLHAELSKKSPEMADRIVFVSAGAFTKEAKDFVARTTNLFLPKPLSSEKLRQAIERVMGKPTT